MYCILTGEIKLSRELTDDELIDLGFLLQRKALDRRLNVYMYGNLPHSGLYNYPLKTHADKSIIPYQITETPIYDQCNRIFNGIWWVEDNWHIARVDESGLPVLQAFYEEVMQNELIEYMTLYFETVHGDADMKPYDMIIKAGEMCRTLEEAPNDGHYEFPPVRLKIVK